MRILAATVFIFLVAVSCEPQASREETKEETVALPAGYKSYGDMITGENTVNTATFLEKFNADSLNVKLETSATAVCKKKGCWMNVKLDDGNTMKVTFKDYGFFVPKDIEGKKVIIQGVAKKQVTDLATLKHYAEDAGKSAEEIAAITEPREEIVFEAEGVLIAD